jgi:hypothetical protein
MAKVIFNESNPAAAANKLRAALKDAAAGSLVGDQDESIETLMNDFIAANIPADVDVRVMRHGNARRIVVSAMIGTGVQSRSRK